MGTHRALCRGLQPNPKPRTNPKYEPRWLFSPWEKDKKRVGITKQREVTVTVRGQRCPLFKVRESPRATRDRKRKAGAHIRKGYGIRPPAVGRKPKKKQGKGPGSTRHT